MIVPQLFELGAGTAEDRLATIERWIAAQNPLLDHLADRGVKLEAASGNTAVVLADTPRWPGLRLVNDDEGNGEQ